MDPFKRLSVTEIVRYSMESVFKTKTAKQHSLSALLTASYLLSSTSIHVLL